MVQYIKQNNKYVFKIKKMQIFYHCLWTDRLCFVYNNKTHLTSHPFFLSF